MNVIATTEKPIYYYHIYIYYSLLSIIVIITHNILYLCRAACASNCAVFDINI